MAASDNEQLLPLDRAYGTFRESVLDLMRLVREHEEGGDQASEASIEFELRPVDERFRRPRSISFYHRDDPNAPRIERMQGVPIDSDEEEAQARDDEIRSASGRKCVGMVDYFEPALYILTILTLIALVYVGIADFDTFLLVVMVYTIITSLIAIWRVRKLGVAKALMDSVGDLRAENVRLKHSIEDVAAEAQGLKENNIYLQESINTLQMENEKFMKLVGLLGDNIGDLNKTKAALMKDLERLDNANMRYEANNLMNLFFLVDRDQGGTLSPQEVDKMNGYIKAVYGVTLDSKQLDTDADGKVDMKEFISQFEHTIASPAREIKEEMVDIIIH